LGGTSEFLRGQVRDLILTTKAHLPGIVSDAALLIDIDLSILGKDAKRFAEFEVGIRSEYEWVPPDVYCSKRAEIMETFLNRERIYTTNSLRDRYEANARRNIGELVARLRRSGV
jgi:predicted metal-dependent HD superfamily phosphohydrolase